MCLRTTAFFLYLFLLPSGFSSVFAQTAAPADSLALPVQIYFSTVRENSHLYNGPEYITVDPNIKGIPFFETDQLDTGTLFYDGMEYPGVPMLYDLYTDKVVINRYQQNFRISLVPEKLRSFDFRHHHFVRFGGDSIRNRVMSPGLYDEVYHGKTTVWVSRKKIDERKVEYNTESQVFRSTDRYFVESGGRFWEVSARSALAGPFVSRRQELKKLIRRNKLSLKKRPEEALAALAAAFDRLNP